MVKRILPNDQVIHVWAAQSQDEARTGNGNLSFSGATLYSYSTPIANIRPGADGQPVALVTSESFSVTTSGKHMPGGRALSHMRRFDVPFLLLPPGQNYGRNGAERVSQNTTRRDWQNDESGDDFAARKLAADHAANVSHMLASYRAEMDTARRKRALPSWCDGNATRYHLGVPVEDGTLPPAIPCGDSTNYGQPGRHLAQLRRYCDAFGLVCPELPDAEADRAAVIAAFEARRAKNDTPAARAKREREAARRAEREAEAEARRVAAIAKARAEGAEKLALWLAGDDVALPYEARATETGGAYVRVIRDEVQTSQGARVPLSAGRMLLAMAARCRATGTPLHGSHRVGSFRLSAIDAEGNARVGCHLLEWPQMEAAAQRAGIAIPAA
jgi:hypothetical protein